jgi:N-sulfoglucosamine sulfohydrolase
MNFNKIFGLFALVLALGSVSLFSQSSKNYNILLFTADDLHAESMGVYGSKANMTPNLDRFAETGLVFEYAHVNTAICSPSRKIIATGLYGHNSGAMGFDPTRVDVPNIVDTLKNAGYLTGVFCKVVHSTPNKTTKWDYVGLEQDMARGRSPTLFYEHTKRFLERAKTEGKPFYLMVNSEDPHRPYCSPENLGHKDAEPPSRFFSPDEVEVPGFLPDLPGVREELANYQNSVRRLDDTFGRVIEALDESGVADSTLVVFLSDNGIAVPFSKANVYHHANRTPLIMRMPHVIERGSRDRTHLVSEVDFFPTFLDLTDIEGPKRLNGRSFLPLLKGRKQEERKTVFKQIDKLISQKAYPMRSVQDDRYIYIYNPFSNGKRRYRNNNEGQSMKAMEEAANSDPELQARVRLFRYRVRQEFYDLKEDPNCLINLMEDSGYASEISRMKAELKKHMKSATDPMLRAFENMGDQTVVERVIEEVYGKQG